MNSSGGPGGPARLTGHGVTGTSFSTLIRTPPPAEPHPPSLLAHIHGDPSIVKPHDTIPLLHSSSPPVATASSAVGNREFSSASTESEEVSGSGNTSGSGSQLTGSPATISVITTRGSSVMEDGSQPRSILRRPGTARSHSPNRRISFADDVLEVMTATTTTEEDEEEDEEEEPSLHFQSPLYRQDHEEEGEGGEERDFHNDTSEDSSPARRIGETVGNNSTVRAPRRATTAASSSGLPIRQPSGADRTIPSSSLGSPAPPPLTSPSLPRTREMSPFSTRNPSQTKEMNVNPDDDQNEVSSTESEEEEGFEDPFSTSSSSSSSASSSRMHYNAATPDPHPERPQESAPIVASVFADTTSSIGGARPGSALPPVPPAIPTPKSTGNVSGSDLFSQDSSTLVFDSDVPLSIVGTVKKKGGLVHAVTQGKQGSRPSLPTGRGPPIPLVPKSRPESIPRERLPATSTSAPSTAEASLQETETSLLNATADTVPPVPPTPEGSLHPSLLEPESSETTTQKDDSNEGEMLPIVKAGVVERDRQALKSTKKEGDGAARITRGAESTAPEIQIPIRQKSNKELSTKDSASAVKEKRNEQPHSSVKDSKEVLHGDLQVQPHHSAGVIETTVSVSHSTADSPAKKPERHRKSPLDVDEDPKGLEGRGGTSLRALERLGFFRSDDSPRRSPSAPNKVRTKDAKDSTSARAGVADNTTNTSTASRGKTMKKKLVVITRRKRVHEARSEEDPVVRLTILPLNEHDNAITEKIDGTLLDRCAVARHSTVLSTSSTGGKKDDDTEDSTLGPTATLVRTAFREVLSQTISRQRRNQRRSSAPTLISSPPRRILHNTSPQTRSRAKSMPLYARKDQASLFQSRHPPHAHDWEVYSPSYGWLAAPSVPLIGITPMEPSPALLERVPDGRVARASERSGGSWRDDSLLPPLSFSSSSNGYNPFEDVFLDDPLPMREDPLAVALAAISRPQAPTSGTGGVMRLDRRQLSSELRPLTLSAAPPSPLIVQIPRPSEEERHTAKTHQIDPPALSETLLCRFLPQDENKKRESARRDPRREKSCSFSSALSSTSSTRSDREPPPVDASHTSERSGDQRDATGRKEKKLSLSLKKGSSGRCTVEREGGATPSRSPPPSSAEEVAAIKREEQRIHQEIDLLRAAVCGASNSVSAARPIEQDDTVVKPTSMAVSTVVIKPRTSAVWDHSLPTRSTSRRRHHRQRATSEGRRQSGSQRKSSSSHSVSHVGGTRTRVSSSSRLGKHSEPNNQHHKARPERNGNVTGDSSPMGNSEAKQADRKTMSSFSEANRSPRRTTTRNRETRQRRSQSHHADHHSGWSQSRSQHLHRQTPRETSKRDPPLTIVNPGGDEPSYHSQLDLQESPSPNTGANKKRGSKKKEEDKGKRDSSRHHHHHHHSRHHHKRKPREPSTASINHNSSASPSPTSRETDVEVPKHRHRKEDRNKKRSERVREAGKGKSHSHRHHHSHHHRSRTGTKKNSSRRSRTHKGDLTERNEDIGSKDVSYSTPSNIHRREAESVEASLNGLVQTPAAERQSSLQKETVLPNTTTTTTSIGNGEALPSRGVEKVDFVSAPHTTVRQTTVAPPPLSREKTQEERRASIQKALAEIQVKRNSKYFYDRSVSSNYARSSVSADHAHPSALDCNTEGLLDRDHFSTRPRSNSSDAPASDPVSSVFPSASPGESSHPPIPSSGPPSIQEKHTQPPQDSLTESAQALGETTRRVPLATMKPLFAFRSNSRQQRRSVEERNDSLTGDHRTERNSGSVDARVSLLSRHSEPDVGLTWRHAAAKLSRGDTPNQHFSSSRLSSSGSTVVTKGGVQSEYVDNNSSFPHRSLSLPHPTVSTTIYSTNHYSDNNNITSGEGIQRNSNSTSASSLFLSSSMNREAGEEVGTATVPDANHFHSSAPFEYSCADAYSITDAQQARQFAENVAHINHYLRQTQWHGGG